MNFTLRLEEIIKAYGVDISMGWPDISPVAAPVTVLVDDISVGSGVGAQGDSQLRLAKEVEQAPSRGNEEKEMSEGERKERKRARKEMKKAKRDTSLVEFAEDGGQEEKKLPKKKKKKRSSEHE
jgi:hypothetical protein